MTNTAADWVKEIGWKAGEVEACRCEISGNARFGAESRHGHSRPAVPATSGTSLSKSAFVLPHRFVYHGLVFFVFALMTLTSVIEARAQTITDLCNRGTLSAAVGTITAETISYGGVDRHYCTYTSSQIGPGTQHPLLIALHGGVGNGSQMMQDDRNIIAQAESRGYIAVFPNGLPRRSCGAASLCADNGWGEPDDIFFLAELIDRMKASGQVLDNRIHMVGFSGGASQIYKIVATPGFPHRIRSIATVAGALGLFNVTNPDRGFSTVPLDQGTAVNALLVQGGSDPRLPAAGGLDETEREAHVSFRTKVDFWRLLTGTQSVSPQQIDMGALTQSAPPDATALRYSQAGLTVVEVLDPSLVHGWPSWDIMAVIADFFERS